MHRATFAIISGFTWLTGAPALSAGPTTETSSQRNAALLSAAESDDAPQIKALLSNGADANIRGKLGWTPFMFVALKNDISSMKLLLSKGAGVNARSTDGSTALMNASQLGRYKAVLSLLSMGAAVNLRDKDHHTALMNAADSWDDIVEVLLNHGAKVNVHDSYGNTPLIMATMSGHGPSALNRQFYERRLRIVRLLLDHGADPNLAAKNGFTALMSGSRRGNIAMVRLLLQHHANVTAMDSKRKSAITYARANHQSEVANLLTAAQTKAK